MNLDYYTKASVILVIVAGVMYIGIRLMNRER